MMSASMVEKVYTVKEVAEILRLDPRTVRKMIANEEIDAFVVRGEYRIQQSALDAVMNKRQKSSGN